MVRTWKSFSNLSLRIAIFLHSQTFYDQIDGFTMGSPLAPALANLFMGHNEKIFKFILIQNRDGVKPTY